MFRSHISRWEPQISADRFSLFVNGNKDKLESPQWPIYECCSLLALSNNRKALTEDVQEFRLGSYELVALGFPASSPVQDKLVGVLNPAFDPLGGYGIRISLKLTEE